jgi:hypothetical protein
MNISESTLRAHVESQLNRLNALEDLIINAPTAGQRLVAFQEHQMLQASALKNEQRIYDMVMAPAPKKSIIARIFNK